MQQFYRQELAPPHHFFPVSPIGCMQMYDHLYQRGYVREIPGAPMCACIEQMAVVSRADCTQLDVDETWEFNIDTSGKLDAHIIKVDIDFNACQVSQCLRKPFNGFVPNTSIIRRHSFLNVISS